MLKQLLPRRKIKTNPLATTRDDSEGRKVDRKPIIKVIGIGSIGCGVIKGLAQRPLDGLDEIGLFKVDTDFGTCPDCKLPGEINLSIAVREILKLNYQRRQIPDKSLIEITDQIGEADILFIVASLKDKMSAEAAIVISHAAESIGAIAIGVVDNPFPAHLELRTTEISKGETIFLTHFDSMIVATKSRYSPEKEPLRDDQEEDHVKRRLYESVQDILNITRPDALINFNLHDIQNCLTGHRLVTIGSDVATGENSSARAATFAFQDLISKIATISSQTHTSDKTLSGYRLVGMRGSVSSVGRSVDGGARFAITDPSFRALAYLDFEHALVNVSGSSNMTMEEFVEASELICQKKLGEKEPFIGLMLDKSFGKKIKVTILCNFILSTNQ